MPPSKIVGDATSLVSEAKRFVRTNLSDPLTSLISFLRQ